MGRRKPQSIPAEAAIRAEVARLCDWPGCIHGEGLYRAPKSRDNLKSFYWFCLEHIREYNKSWNYYAGMTDVEVEADVRKDTVWHRPSWPMGGASDQHYSQTARIKDPFGFFDDSEPDASDANTALNGVSPAETQALVILELRPPLSVDDVKARYKELVKRHHPDANGGDKKAEERFKQISQAYETIMNCLGA